MAAEQKRPATMDETEDVPDSPVSVEPAEECDLELPLVFVAIRWGLAMTYKASGLFVPDTAVDGFSLKQLYDYAHGDGIIDSLPTPDLERLSNRIRSSDVGPKDRRTRFRGTPLAAASAVTGTPASAILYRDVQRYIGTKLAASLPKEALLCVVNYSDTDAVVTASPSIAFYCKACGNSRFPFERPMKESSGRAAGESHATIDARTCPKCDTVSAEPLVVHERELKRDTYDRSIAGRTAQFLAAVRHPVLNRSRPAYERKTALPGAEEKGKGEQKQKKSPIALREGHFAALASINAISRAIGDTIEVETEEGTPAKRCRVRKAALLFTDVSEEKSFTLMYAAQFDTHKKDLFEHIPLTVVQFGNHRDGGPGYWQTVTSMDYTQRITSCSDIPGVWSGITEFLNKALSGDKAVSMPCVIRNKINCALRINDWIYNPIFLPPGRAVLTRLPVEGDPPLPVIVGEPMDNWRSTELHVNIREHVNYVTHMRDRAVAQCCERFDGSDDDDDEEDAETDGYHADGNKRRHRKKRRA